MRVRMAGKVVFIATILTVFISGGALAEQSADSQLSQEISYIDCTTTGLTGGSRDTRCLSVVYPTITYYAAKRSELYAEGTYNSFDATKLRVWAVGRWYELGVDSELSAQGDIWRFSLLRPGGFGVGDYKIIVEVSTKDRLLLKDQATAKLKGETIDSNIPQEQSRPLLAQPDNNSLRGRLLLARDFWTHDKSAYWVIVFIVVMGSLWMLFWIFWRRNHDKNKQHGIMKNKKNTRKDK